jgi:dTDP-4-dehydrorhamnose reductase
MREEGVDGRRDGPARVDVGGGPELWGGVECTVNRVGDEFFDQLCRSGHAGREGDLEMFAALGVRALRTPVLWERTAPEEPDSADWSWADRCLARLRGLNVRPIIGLVHHGSGPRHTSLVDPDFPEKLAAYARAVARRYPWAAEYTPVNEPLTTARFSGLYGHWYPHGRDARTFARALLNECRAVALAMRAIREVNPAARLVQTEDLAKTHSTPALRYQADFENERRWLTFDLLCGRVGRAHPLWGYLRRVCEVTERELEWFADNPCPPDVIGLNHYLTSERFLDEQLERYPPHAHGGNGTHRYADVEAVRVLTEGNAGPRALLGEAWERYKLPLAVTEVHLGCTREEQLRWFKEVWEAARSLRREGADVRAVTAWALLGAFDWNALATCRNGHYEPGCFDLRAPAPRPTAVARMARALAGGGEFDHPLLDSPGWWRRGERLIYVPPQERIEPSAPETPRPARAPRPLLVVGGTGTLGYAFSRICDARGIHHLRLTRRDFDLTDEAGLDAALEKYKPWAVVNCAGYVRVDDAELEPEACLRVNTHACALLAEACAARGVQFVTYSSDLVFDGAAGRPYVEGDATSPVNVYGRSKAEAEARVQSAHAGALVIRTSAFFGPWDAYNFLTVMTAVLAAGQRFVAADDVQVSPTYVPDLVNASLDLLIDGERGVWHLANEGAVTWAEFARMGAEGAGLDVDEIDARPLETLGLIAPRPRYSVLGSERGRLMPPLADAIARYTRECFNPHQRMKQALYCA